MDGQEIKEIMSKALELSKSQYFNVSIHKQEIEPMSEYKSMNYMELGLFLTQNCRMIDKIEIYMRE